MEKRFKCFFCLTSTRHERKLSLNLGSGSQFTSSHELTVVLHCWACFPRGAGCIQGRTIGAGWLAPAEPHKHRCDRVLGSVSGERERGGDRQAAKLLFCQAVKWAPVLHMGQSGRRQQDAL